jgi:hypothetical protein
VGLPTLTKPVEVITTIVRDVRAEQYQKELAQKFAAIRKQQKANWAAINRAEQKNFQDQFLATHSGTPKLFNHAEVAELNMYLFLFNFYFFIIIINFYFFIYYMELIHVLNLFLF